MTRSLFRCAAAVVLAVGAFVLTLASPPAAKAADEDVVSKMTSGRLERIMGSFRDLEYKELDNNIYRLETAGFKFLLFNKGETMQLSAGFRVGRVSLSRINEWNKIKRFAKAYLDKDNDPVLEMDIELTGGVTEKNVKEWMKTFVMMLKEFKKYLDE